MKLVTWPRERTRWSREMGRSAKSHGESEVRGPEARMPSLGKPMSTGEKAAGSPVLMSRAGDHGAEPAVGDWRTTHCCSRARARQLSLTRW